MKFMMDIREKTSLLHSAAENTGYIKKLVDGNASVEGYAEYIYNLERMYKAIEDALDKNENNAIVKPFVTRELYRSELIRKDLEFLLGDKLNSLKLLASTEACVAKIEELSNKIEELLEEIQKHMYNECVERVNKKTTIATNMDEFEKNLKENQGYVKAMWCGDEACEDKIKELTGAKSRCIPFEQEHLSDKCVCCGKPATKMVYWGRQY